MHTQVIGSKTEYHKLYPFLTSLSSIRYNRNAVSVLPDSKSFLSLLTVTLIFSRSAIALSLDLFSLHNDQYYLLSLPSLVSITLHNLPMILPFTF